MTTTSQNQITGKNGVASMPEAVRQYFASIGAKGGRVVSTLKAASSRANGAKGGRPRAASIQAAPGMGGG